MSETKHTPGPWWLTDSGVRDYGGYIAHTNSVQRYEGQDERYSREVEQRAADKLLIAAAPDLLAALQNIRTAYQTGHNADEAWGWVDAAIAKATTGA